MTTNRTQMIKTLRAKTKASLDLIREALESCGNDLAQAERYIAERAGPGHDGGQGAGLIVANTHQGRIGAMVEVRCATDFVARTEEFRTLCQELVLQVIAGVSEAPLAEQVWIRDSSRQVGSLIDACSRQVGEQITVRRSVRWEL